MIRFLIFAGEKYYPRGGFNDLIATRTMEDKAIETAKKALGRKLRLYDKEFDENFTSQSIEWVQVLDTKTGKVVFQEGEIHGGSFAFQLEQTQVGLSPYLAEGEDE